MEFHTAHSLSRIHGLDLLPRQRSLRARLGALIEGAIERLRAAARRHTDRQRLFAMSERELADIGLTRCDVVAAFSRGGQPLRRRNREEADA